MNTIPSIIEKYTGAMLASAIGDALGWPNEHNNRKANVSQQNSDTFIEWTRYSGGRFWNHAETILPGEYSDDTQMILAVSRSIFSEDWKNTFLRNELPFWLDYERGGGNATKNAAKIAKAGKIPWEASPNMPYFNAGGNGASMRILPHIISQANDHSKFEEILVDVIKNSIFTHGHPRAILGAACYAYALFCLLKKEIVLCFGELIDSVIDGIGQWSSFPDSVIFSNWIREAEACFGNNYASIWSSTVSSMLEKLMYMKSSIRKGLLAKDEDILRKLECFDKANGAGDVAALSALYLASKYSSNPVLGIKTAAYAKGADTDTIASMTGGLLGMLNGTAWIPTEWKSVQDYQSIINITGILLSEDMKEAAERESAQYRSSNKAQENKWILSSIGKIRMLASSTIPSGSSGNIIVKKMETEFGQTFYTKNFVRIKGKAVPYVEANPLQLTLNEANSAAFILNAQDIAELESHPALQKITFRKVMQIISRLYCYHEDSALIAKKLNVQENAVEAVKQYVVLIDKRIDFT